MQHTVAPIVPQCASRLDHGWFQQPFAGWALNGYYCPWFPSPILYLRRGCIRTPLFQRKRKRSDNDQIPATQERTIRMPLFDRTPDEITRLVAGEVAFLEWNAMSEHAKDWAGANSYLIRDGQIHVQTIHFLFGRDERTGEDISSERLDVIPLARTRVDAPHARASEMHTADTDALPTDYSGRDAG